MSLRGSTGLASIFGMGLLLGAPVACAQQAPQAQVLDSVVVYGVVLLPQGGATGGGFSGVIGHDARGPLLAMTDSATASDQNPTNCGDPIIPSTGNEIEPERDFTTTGEFPLVVDRTYNYMWKGTGLFGPHWTSSLDYKLVNGSTIFNNSCSSNCAIGATQTIQSWRPDGRTIVYHRDAADARLYWEDKASSVAKIVVQADGTATLYADDNSIERYAADGTVLSVSNAQGIGWTFTYSGGKPVKVTHTSGRYLQLTWTGAQLTSVRDPAGGVYSYGYSGSKLISMTAPGTPATTVSYLYESGDPWALTGKSINGARYSTIAYSSGRATSSQQNGTNKYTFAYTDNADGTTTVVETTPLGKQSTLIYKGGKLQSMSAAATAHCPAMAYSVIYDTNGYESRRTDFNGNATDFTYSPDGRLQQQVEASGTAVARKTTFTWDTANNRVTRVVVGGAAAGSEMLQTDYRFAADGRVSSITQTDLSPLAQPSPANTRVTTFTYAEYPNGMLQSTIVDGPLPGTGDALTYTFDQLGNWTGVKNAQAIGTTNSAFNGLGLPGRVTNENGANTDYTYDARGRITNIRTYPGGVAQDYGFTYNALGYLTESDTPDGQVRSYYYAATNKDWLTAIEEPMQPILSGSAWQGTAYDRNAAGEITSQSTYVLRPQIGTPCTPSPCMQLAGTSPLDTATVTTGTDGSQSLTSTSTTYVQDTKTQAFIDYDELGRPIAQRGNNGQNVVSGYDKNGNITALTDSAGWTTTFTYDQLNRLSTSKDAKNGITQFAYDAGDRLTKVVDVRGRATVYSYDGLGQLRSVTSPDSGLISFGYDAYGRRTTLTRADGNVTTYGYDTQGRLTSITAGGKSQTFTYDTCTNGKNKLCKVSDPTGSVSFNYLPEGWLENQTSALPAGGAATVSYSYDGMGRIAGLVYPNGQSATYGYGYGQPTDLDVTIGSTTTSVIAAARYLPFGPVTGWSSGNGLARSYTYDLDGRLTGVSSKDGTTLLQSLTLGYDARDVISKITNGINASLTQSFGYDELTRLTAANAPAISQGFTYDASGNRTTHTHGGVTDTYTTATTSNRLLSLSGSVSTSYGYDANGNITSGEGITYDYDEFNRLATATKGTVITTYAVNGLGQRVFKQVGTSNTWFVYGPDNTLLAEYRPGQGWTNYLVFAGEPVGFTRSNAVSWIHNDQLGRPELVTNAAKTVTWRASNYAFTRLVSLDTIGGLNIGLPGQYYDAETGNWNNGFRDYNEDRGRYLQADPFGAMGGSNVYAYVSNSPVSNVDPLGLFDIRAWKRSDGGYSYTIRFYSGTFGWLQRAGPSLASSTMGQVGKVLNNVRKAVPRATGTSGQTNKKDKAICDANDDEAEQVFNNTVNSSYKWHDEADMRKFLDAFFTQYPQMKAYYGGTDAMINDAHRNAQGWGQ